MAVSIKVIRDDFVQAKQNYEESNNIAAYTDFLTTYSDETLAKPFINSINEVLSNETKPKPPKVDVMSEILAEHDSKKPVEPKVEKNPTVKVAQPKRKDRVKPNTPGIYVSLPSKGRWYSGELEMSADGEIEVFPLRAKDELRLKSPDALFNGEALVSVLENIVPGIPNVIDMPVADQNVIMCGAYLATYGNDYTLSITCPKCSSIKPCPSICQLIKCQLNPKTRPMKDPDRNQGLMISLHCRLKIKKAPTIARGKRPRTLLVNMAPAVERPKTRYQGFWSFALKTAKNARVTKNARGISIIARREASTNIPGKSRTKAEAKAIQQSL